MENADQRDFWTDKAGPVWTAQMEAMDAVLAPVMEGVLARAALQSGEAVLDIGCGAGTLSLVAAAAVRAEGRVLGADISQTLLSVARTQAHDVQHLSFELADAQTYDFAPDSFDVMLSRFGTMFFSDTEAAFANLARALRLGGRMCFATWGQIPQNPFFTLPAGVAKRVIGSVPKSDPDMPGPFALRDTALVEGILARIGMVEIRSDVVTLDLTPSGPARAVAEVMCEIGPAQVALEHFEADEALRKTLITALSEALAPFETAQGLRIPASINFFTARKPS